MRRPKLNSLTMFDAAARHLNFRLAAEELNLTQGAVAQQVRRLEADLGFQLFQRVARGLVLTDIGRSYHTPVRRALAIIEEATARLRPDNRRVTLSVTPSFASKWLVPRLADFAAANPDIDLQTVASERLANFQSDGVDIAIRQGLPAAAAGLRIEMLAPLELCAVCSPELATQLPSITRLEDFVEQALIQDSHGLWDTLFEEVGIETGARTMKFNQTALAMDAAANGQGIALAPRLLLDDDIAQGRLVELWREVRSDQGGYYVVYPADRQSNPAVQIVIAWALSEVTRSGEQD